MQIDPDNEEQIQVKEKDMPTPSATETSPTALPANSLTDTAKPIKMEETPSNLGQTSDIFQTTETLNSAEQISPKTSPWDKIKIPKKAKTSVPRRPSVNTFGKRPVGRPRKISSQSGCSELVTRRGETAKDIHDTSSDLSTASWNETEIVVTDIKVNSSVITFLECATKNGLLS